MTTHQHQWKILETTLADGEPASARVECTMCGYRDTIVEDPDSVDLAAIYANAEWAPFPGRIQVVGDDETAVPELGGLREEMDDVLLRAAQLRGAPDADARAELTQRVRIAAEIAVDAGPYGDASGHLGRDGFQDITTAAVDAFLDYLREQRP